MWSTAYATPLRLELKPSPKLLWVLAFAHLGAAGLLLTTSLPAWAVSCLALGVLGSFLWLTTRHALLMQSGAVVWLLWGAGNEWLLGARDGTRMAAQLNPQSFVRPWLTVLLLAPASGGPMRNVVILPDSLDAESFRRLRVRLRLESTLVAAKGSG